MVQLKRSLGGPAEYFDKHPAVYVLSLAGAGAAVAAFATRAAGANGIRRLGWIALFALEAMIFIGMVVTREESRRSRSA